MIILAPIFAIFIVVFIIICAFIVNAVTNESLVPARDYTGGRGTYSKNKSDRYITRKHISIVKSTLSYAPVVEIIKTALSNDIANLNPIATFAELKHRLPYSKDVKINSSSVHLGQIKLFLSELEFMTYCLHEHSDSALFVYAGSAPSHKILLLCDMFPNIKMLLIDPHDHHVMGKTNAVVYLKTTSVGKRYGIGKHHFNVYAGGRVVFAQRKNIAELTRNVIAPDIDFIKSSSYKIYIYEDYMTEQIARLFSDTSCYFISDIRTNMEGDSPSDLDIIWNSAQQLVWLDKMRPIKSMLKFRPPYNAQPNSEIAAANYPEIIASKALGIDFVADHAAGKFKYFQPETIFLQAFAGVNSSETRLIVSNYSDFHEYDPKDYDEKFSCFNKIQRGLIFHNHEMLDKSMRIDGCNDCALMAKIYSDYNKKYNLKFDGLAQIKDITGIMNRSFQEYPLHGLLYKQYPNLDAVQQYQMYIPYIMIFEEYRDVLAG